MKYFVDSVETDWQGASFKKCTSGFFLNNFERLCVLVYACSCAQTQQEIHEQWTSSLSHKAKCRDRVEQSTVGFFTHSSFFFTLSNQQEQRDASLASISSQAL